MRTFSGEEALEIAEEHNLTLYDVNDKAEVTAAEARGLIQTGRNARSFVLQHWPETEEEAERLVLSACYELLRNQLTADIRVSQLRENENHPFPMHPKAAELAAQSLAMQHKLEIKERSRDGNVYCIPAAWHLNDLFLDSLSEVVCDDCAHLQLNGAFHESCLQNLIEFISQDKLNFDDIAEHRAPKADNHRIAKMLPNIEIPWLQKTATLTRERWMNVIKPRFVRDFTESESSNEQKSREVNLRPKAPTRTPQLQEESIIPLVDDETAERVAKEMAAASSTGIGAEYTRARTKVSKENLIQDLAHYLRSVEILDENGELMKLQMERTKLLDQIAQREKEFEELERQRGFLESQCNEMQRDLDTLLQAMQVAKRRNMHGNRIIDATHEIEGDFE